MKVLVAFASRHGSTREIADGIAQELRVAGHSVAVRAVDLVQGIERYDAAVIGSAVYMGDWLPEARHFAEENHAALGRLPVWLFSSGPLGTDDPQPHGDPAHLEELVQAIRANGHQRFVGKLDRDRLGIRERLIATVVKAPDGDFRDWQAVRVWAREIALRLTSLAASAT